MDFFSISESITEPKKTKREIRPVLTIYPNFIVAPSRDLMVRGGAFYAIWDEGRGLWSTNESDVSKLVDKKLVDYSTKRKGEVGEEYDVRVQLLRDYSNGHWAKFKGYIKHMFDSFVELDTTITFANTEVRQHNYVSKRVSYNKEEGSIEAYDELMSTLYSPSEREKLEWAIGSIITGDSKDIQKFFVLFGDKGTGKSTFLHIVEDLFRGYCISFEAKSIGQMASEFSMEVFRTNPLIAIQHDGDLSKIEDNTRLNSMVSHEVMTMKEKFKSGYDIRLNTMLFLGTNKPVKITDSKSGLIRRLIDVQPTGDKIPVKRYFVLTNKIKLELGAIAHHCEQLYLQCGKNYYNDYTPFDMILQTDVFFNFMDSNMEIFKEQDRIGITQAYSMYNAYCDSSNLEFRMPLYKFREELKTYFRRYEDRGRIGDKQIRSIYSGFIFNKFIQSPLEREEELERSFSLDLSETVSLLDDALKDCPAQYATEKETPKKKWDSVDTVLADLETYRLHYIRPPLQHIVIDFDLRDSAGNKSPELNLAEASKWPPTYAEFSKSGAGVHLHYRYEGDVEDLSRIFEEGIEIKVFVGASALRRRLTLCNDIPIATIASDRLPKREGGKKMINFDAVRSEESIRKLIERNLRKEIHPGTKPSIDFIHKILEDLYNSGVKYDLTDLRQPVLIFANNSTNQSEYCMRLVSKMKFCSEPELDFEPVISDDADKELPLVFYDVEVFPNLFVVCWKLEGPDNPVIKMINPTAADMEKLFQFRLVGFNCRRYDNHILYGRYIGYDNQSLYHLSQQIINDGSRDAFFSEAYNISYTDVYDYANAYNKKSLKKWEIDLGIHHQELGLPWDQEVDPSMWEKVAEYCANDVVATEAVHNKIYPDFIARKILAELTGLTPNDTTNTLSTAFIFGKERKPKLVYTDLATGEQFY